MFLPIWIDEIGKNQDKSINETSVIDFYRLIEPIDINQIRFTDFYWFIDLQIDTDLYRLTTPGFRFRHCTTTAWNSLVRRLIEDVTTRRRVQFFLFLDLNLVLKNLIPGKFSDIVILWGLYSEIIVIIIREGFLILMLLLQFVVSLS